MRKLQIVIEERKMPESINGVLVDQENDNFLILINSCLSDQDKISAFLHECMHIYRKDFECDEMVDQFEIDRHIDVESIFDEMAM